MIEQHQIDLLVQARVHGLGLNAAAEHSGMSRASAWRYLQRDEVQQQLAEARAERSSALVAYIEQIRSLADLVTDAMVAILDEEPDHSTIIRLASVVLPEVRHLSMLDLAERIERLEQRQEMRAA